MDNLDMIDNRLNNATCPKLIESLIYQRKGAEVDFTTQIKELYEEEERLRVEKEVKLGLLEKLKEWLQYDWCLYTDSNIISLVILGNI